MGFESSEDLVGGCSGEHANEDFSAEIVGEVRSAAEEGGEAVGVDAQEDNFRGGYGAEELGVAVSEGYEFGVGGKGLLEAGERSQGVDMGGVCKFGESWGGGMFKEALKDGGAHEAWNMRISLGVE